MSRLALIASSRSLPTLITATGDPAVLLFLEFFTVRIRNPNIRRAVADFLAWCEDNRVSPSISAMPPAPSLVAQPPINSAACASMA